MYSDQKIAKGVVTGLLLLLAGAAIAGFGEGGWSTVGQITMAVGVAGVAFYYGYDTGSEAAMQTLTKEFMEEALEEGYKEFEKTMGHVGVGMPIHMKEQDIMKQLLSDLEKGGFSVKVMSLDDPYLLKKGHGRQEVVDVEHEEIDETTKEITDGTDSVD